MEGGQFGELLDLLNRDVISASKSLLGWRLRKGNLLCQIVEVEAYRTPDDPACHAHRGLTKRNRVLFGPAGFAYVYFTYGHHWMLNISAHEPGNAAAVLIRAARPLEGLDEMRVHRGLAKKDTDLLSGPGKICQALQIEGELDGAPLLTADRSSESNALRLEPGPKVISIWEGVRVGIAPGKGDSLPWRFIDLNEARWASRPYPKGE